MAQVVVVGAGLGGLAAAIELAADGHRVAVLEAMAGPGGKAGTIVHDGVEMDTGPSVLTLPDVFDALFRRAGSRLADEVTLVEPSPAFRYLWPDGARFDVHVAPEATFASARAAFGPAAEAELRAFLDYARGIWEVAAPPFVFAPLRAGLDLFKLGLREALRFPKIDPFHTQLGAIRDRVRDPHLRDVLTRYATYNGSDPRRAPATLNLIAHVELGLGGFGVEGGIAELVRALVRSAERLGVELHYGEPVRRLVVEGDRAVGVETDRGVRRADGIVVNADVTHLVETLLPRGTVHGLPRGALSTSGFTQLVRAKRRTDRVAHTVLFCAPYEKEFVDLFDHERPPVDPTVYVCAQEACHRRRGWADDEPLFFMTNAPAGEVRPEGWIDAHRAALHRRAEAAGLLHEGDRVVWERTPMELARQFPGSRGALYGAASNSQLAAFQRPPNRVPKLRGLYLASGSAHPGGGMPLCAQSGRLAAEAARGELR